MFATFKMLCGNSSRTTATTRRRRLFARRPRAEVLEKREVMAALGLDPTFGLGGIAFASRPAQVGNTFQSSSLTNVALQSDGKIVAIGTRSTSVSNGSSSSFTQEILVERRNADSTLDGTFGSGGTATIPLKSGDVGIDGQGVDVAVQADGKIVVLGSTSAREVSGVATPSLDDFAVARLNANGTLDTSFSGTGFRLIDFTPNGTPGNVSDSPSSLALAPGSKIVVAGRTNTPIAFVNGSFTGGQDMAVARLNADGSLDTSFDGDGRQVVAFDLGGSKADDLAAVAVRTDGKVVLVGSAAVANVTVGSQSRSSTDIAVARLNADGSLDGSFGTNGRATIAYDLGGDKSDTASAAVLDGDKVVIAGTATTAPGSASPGTVVSNLTLSRLNANGSLDTSFNGSGKYSLSLSRDGASYNTSGASLAILADSSLVVGGHAANATNFQSAALIAQVQANGTLEPSYATGGVGLLGNTFLAGNIVVTPAGKVVFATGDGLARTTSPSPRVLTAQVVTAAAAGKKKAPSKTLMLKFNTSLNPTLAGKLSTYKVRVGTKGKRFLAIKKVQYDLATSTSTITLKQAAPKGTIQVLLSAAGIADADSQLLNNGQDMAVTITPTTTAKPASSRVSKA